jgi:hypothetical protein
MSTKAVVRALATLGVLVVLWGAFALFRGSVSDAPTMLRLPKLTAADVDQLEVTKGADTLRLAKSDGRWTVNGHAADAALLDQVFGALTDTGVTSELVARSPSSHARLGVDSTGRHAVFKQGAKVLLDLVIGQSGPDYQSAYARQAGTNEVFLLRGNLSSLLGKDLDAWRDRKIAAVPADSVGTVSVWRSGREVVVHRAADGWTVGTARADTGVVGRLLRGLGDVTAIAFASPATADSLDFRRPSRRVLALGPKGDTLLALAFDSTSNGYWSQRGSGGEPFKLDFWRVDQLTPTDSALRGGAR